MICGVTSSSALRSWVRRSLFRSSLLALLAQRRNLALLEIGLGEDLAVHLDENLLDDFGAHGNRRADERRAPTAIASVLIVHR